MLDSKCALAKSFGQTSMIRDVHSAIVLSFILYKCFMGPLLLQEGDISSVACTFYCSSCC